MTRHYSKRLPASADLAERIFARTDRTPGGCWEWMAARDSSGYGVMSVNGSSAWRAHRWAYTVMVEPVGEGLHVDHRCCNRRCVNPAHLEAVTVSENAKRGARARRGLPPVERAAFQCINCLKLTADRMCGMCVECVRADQGEPSSIHDDPANVVIPSRVLAKGWAA